MSKTYADIRSTINNGDVAMVEGSGLISKIIRAFTGGTISHIALFVWIGSDSLFIAEYKEGRGYLLSPASHRIKDLCKSGNVYYGRIPEKYQTQECGNHIYDTAMKYRNGSYGYLSLLRVWFAQITQSRREVKNLVCSTFVERCWESCGYEFKVTSDPSNFLQYCESITPINCKAEAES